MKRDIIAWWSGGITSAVACKLAIDLFGKNRVRILFIDTKNEDDDTYRFKKHCEAWYGLPIETISSKTYKNIREVWRKFKGLNFANGAICSTELKRAVREAWEEENKGDFLYQTHGFDMGETERALAMALNYPDSRPIFPLLLFGITKDKAVQIITDAGIQLPRPYREGYRNNNCYKTGCVRGGIGYWQKRKREFPEATAEMGAIEHELTAAKGKPVTMLRVRRGKNRYPLFITKHPDYPDILCIDEVEGRPVKPLNDCNGYCGINDLSPRSETEEEINYEE